MPKMSEQCFICGKPSVVFYDFLVTESAAQQYRQGTYQVTDTAEAISGIARITLCKECMEDSVNRLIASCSNKNGKPRMFERKNVEELQRFAEEMSKGIYDKTRDKRTPGLDAYVSGLARIFINALVPLKRVFSFDLYSTELRFGMEYLPPERQTPEVIKLFQRNGLRIDSKTFVMEFSKWPDDLKTPLMKRLVNKNSEPQYVLWVPDQAAFTHAIAPRFEGSIRLESLSFEEDYKITGIPSDIQRKKSEVYDRYRVFLKGL